MAARQDVASCVLSGVLAALLKLACFGMRSKKKHVKRICSKYCISRLPAFAKSFAWSRMVRAVQKRRSIGASTSMARPTLSASALRTRSCSLAAASACFRTASMSS